MTTKTTSRRARTGKGGMHDPAIVDIDPNIQVSAHDLKAPARGRPSPWREQLEKLIELVDSGEVDAGNFVCIGKFKSYQGAQHRGARMAEFEPELAAGFSFEYRWEYNTTSTSSLWARLNYAPAATSGKAGVA
jgi:hypothetical protein